MTPSINEECSTMRNRPIAESFMRLLKYSGVEGLGLRVPYDAKKVSRLGFQYVAVESLVREYAVTSESWTGRTLYKCNGLRIVGGKGSDTAYHSLVRKPEGRVLLSFKDILKIAPDPPIPLIAVDLGLIKLHTPEELASLRIQLALTLSVVREYLWDRHLALTQAEREVEDWLWPVIGRNKMIITKNKPGELFWRLKLDKIIILRPDAPEALTPSDVLEADGFLIGGIVDKIPRPGMSRILDTLVPWGEPRRIELRGSVLGVPSRINRIAEILLKARLEYMGSLEQAIVSSMTKSDRVNRLFYELMKRKGPVRMCSVLEEYSWLNPSPDEIRIAAKRAKVKLIDDCSKEG